MFTKQHITFEITNRNGDLKGPSFDLNSSESDPKSPIVDLKRPDVVTKKTEV